jgi:hypothetical protein
MIFCVRESFNDPCFVISINDEVFDEMKKVYLTSIFRFEWREKKKRVGV